MLACNTKSENMINLHLCMPKNYLHCQHTHVLFSYLFIFLLSSATIWRGIWRALVVWRGLSHKTGSSPIDNQRKSVTKVNSVYLLGKTHCTPLPR